jgi:hypothetical protein
MFCTAKCARKVYIETETFLKNVIPQIVPFLEADVIRKAKNDDHTATRVLSHRRTPTTQSPGNGQRANKHGSHPAFVVEFSATASFRTQGRFCHRRI